MFTRSVLVVVVFVTIALAPTRLAPLSPTRAAVPSFPCATCLGSLAPDIAYKLADDTIDHFHRMPLRLAAGARPEVLSIGILYDGPTAQSTWELVKALDRFGTWSDVHFLPTVCWGTAPSDCSEPSYDLTHAHFRSRLVSFVDRDVARIDSSGDYVAYQDLGPQERALYKRYSRFRGKIPPFERKLSPFVRSQVPLIAVGRYEETRTWLDYSFGGYKVGPSEPGVPASTIQHGLIVGKDPPSNVAATPVTDINSITNILVALVCHADGKRPGSVCGLPVIKNIMRHVK